MTGGLMTGGGGLYRGCAAELKEGVSVRRCTCMNGRASTIPATVRVTPGSTPRAACAGSAAASRHNVPPKPARRILEIIWPLRTFCNSQVLYTADTIATTKACEWGTMRLVLIFMVWVSVAGAAAAQPKESSVFELVQDCDLLAAHPEDPQRMAKGVADDAIVPRLAIMACEDPAARGEDVRFAFQLGRALLAQGRKREAVAQFEKAATANYAAAHAYLGDAYQFGYHVPADSAKAIEHYRKAIDGGFESARRQIDQLTFDRTRFVAGAIGDLYDGNFDPLRKADPKLRNYIFNFTQQIMEACGPILEPPNVPGLYIFRYPPGWTIQTDEQIGVAVQTSVGEYDATAFVTRHGCEGPIARRLFLNMNQFFKPS
jgi:hypothetical protein